MKLSGKERKHLRGVAHDLKPVVLIGQNGFTDGLAEAINIALDTHELIKVKFIDFKDEKREIIAMIEEKTVSECVGTIGNVAILFRANKKPEKRKIKTLPEA